MSINLKVLFLTNVPSPYRVDFFNALGELCELTVLFETKTAKSRNEAWIADYIENFKAIYLKGIKIGEAEAFSLEVFKYLSKRKYDIIVIGMYSSPTGMLAIEYMKARKIPFILSSDGGIEKEDFGIKHWMKEHFISAASGWLSTGRLTDEYLVSYGAKKENIFKYPFTSVKKDDILKKPLARDKKEVYRKKLDIQEKRIVLSVGQFIYRKGYDILLKVCSDLDDDIGVYIVGGKVTEEYSVMKKKLKLTNVHFIDFMPKKELADYYRAADIFVLPTREDIWGLVINEAMAYGLPVVTTEKCVAGVEMVCEGHNGYIVPVENTDALKKAIVKAFHISGEAVLNTAKKYSIENMAKSYMRMFELTLKNEDLHKNVEF